MKNITKELGFKTKRMAFPDNFFSFVEGSVADYTDKIAIATKELDKLNVAMAPLVSRYNDWQNLLSKGNGSLSGRGSCGLNSGCSSDDVDAITGSATNVHKQQALIDAKKIEISGLNESLKTAQDVEKNTPASEITKRIVAQNTAQTNLATTQASLSTGKMLIIGTISLVVLVPVVIVIYKKFIKKS